MKDSRNIPNDLFLLLLNLSQFRDRNMVLRVFCQAMEAVWPQLHFDHEDVAGERDRGAQLLPLRTVHSELGVIVVRGGLDELPETERQLLGNAVQMLSLLLERLAQHALLEDRGRVLAAEVEKRTRELAHRTRQLEMVVEGARVGFWDWDVKQGSVRFSDLWGEMLGYAPGEVRHEYSFWEERIHPDDREQTLIDLRRHLRGETPLFVNDHRLYRRDGGWIWVQGQGSVMERDEHGQPLRASGIMIDVTERKQAQKLLQQALERMRYYVSNSPLAVIEWKGGTHVRTWAGRAEEIFGWSADEVLGKNWNDFRIVHPEDAELVQQGIRPMFEGHTHNICANRNLRKDGEVLHCIWYNTALLDEKGRVVSILSQVADVTELKRARLEAEAASRAKSEFLANMSHEIRTPLSGILGMQQLLLSTELDAEQREYVQASVTSAERLTSLLGDILDLSRVEAGKLEIAARPFHLGEALDQLEHLFRPACRQKGLRLTVREEPGIPEVLLGDVARLQQVLTNLVGNAVKFTAEGDVEVLASPLGSAGEQVRVLFCVRDTGIGIDDETLGLLFKPFTQGQTGYTREYQGAGLGLAIVSRLVRLMGGEVSVSSEPGVGTQFAFCVRFGATSQAAPETPEPLSKSDNEHCGLRVLVAEDDRVNRVAITRLLEKRGCEVVAVENGAEALERLRERPFDLVFMDIQMPVMDGVQAARELRAGRAGADAAQVRVVALTAYAMNGDEQTFLDAGMDGYLPKPVSMDALKRVLAEAEAEKVA